MRERRPFRRNTEIGGARIVDVNGAQITPSAERAIALSGSEIEIEDVRITGYTTELIDASSSTLTVRRSDFLDPLFDLDRGIYLDPVPRALAHP